MIFPCSALWNTFAHVKSSKQQHRTNTFKVKCSHLTLAQISPCKTLSKHGTYAKIWPHGFLISIPLGKYNAWKNLQTVQMWTYNFQSVLHEDPWKGNIWWPLKIYTYFIEWPFNNLTIFVIQSLKREVLNNVKQHRP